MNRRIILIFALILIVTLAGVGYAISQQSSDKHADDHDSTSSHSTSNNAVDLPLPANGEAVSKEGTIACLKHINSDGPQTMECAIGIELPDGSAYGLQSDDSVIIGIIPTGQKVRVEGTLMQAENSKYRTSGTIRVQAITKL